MKEPSPSQHVSGIFEHLLPFAAITMELWRVLMERLVDDFQAMSEADRQFLAARPHRFDTRPGRDALQCALRERTADLKEARDRAEGLPKGWFSWTRTARERKAAIEEAAAALKTWQGAGTISFIQTEAAKIERGRHRQDKKIRDFDARPDVVQAVRRLDDLPGVLRMAEGLAELKPDKELHAALAPVVGQDGGLLRIDAVAGLALLRRRVAIAAAVSGAGGKTGGPKSVMEPEPADVVAVAWEQATSAGLDDLASLGM
ncbi:hypothetical protein Gbth_003_058 [Gluconobacter thailandicus F149-1 = NBRC 100600]|uniref:TIGR02677 family protein n=1 Tax=Gluconobacter thailandicus NBRC 3257 TaxID=1381097 RepID=A0ABQ0IZK8_GLUTH|nr:hypothetical protein [Gluconobacter thailandicus]KXV53560.1 hypothetical protein AD946_07455 [Gluconobacter thailandicus]GAC88463.1 hypothetical protein NBRC3255_2124 [Gluconobacter thailandicus NBRC 3255]GAD27641.1 hypothetical protein NBRC3257_2640 [Gluconobacter thailandicus NBRC 3257]GAN91984.1 hypothetical protein Gbth_003_058 [Gluconobacter thailandicus F149-1 = NBRC 100600]GBR61685.1 hypothetical protein AA100600_3016 [Gluconobacter thailandicus F149-1 = NBRC 100600]